MVVRHNTQGESRLEGKLGSASAVWRWRGLYDPGRRRPVTSSTRRRKGLAKDTGLGVIRVGAEVQPWAQVSTLTSPRTRIGEDLGLTHGASGGTAEQELGNLTPWACFGCVPTKVHTKGS